jgi:hypothetical protein
MGGMVVENPYFQEPDELLATASGLDHTDTGDIEGAAEWCYDVTTGST